MDIMLNNITLYLWEYQPWSDDPSIFSLDMLSAVVTIFLRVNDFKSLFCYLTGLIETFIDFVKSEKMTFDVIFGN